MDLIPNLNNDAASHCLMRLHYDQLANAANVSRGWKAEIEDPSFHAKRRATGVTEPIVVVLQGCEDLEEARFRVTGYDPAMPYNLAMLNLKTGRWSNLPSVPDFQEGMPSYCCLAGVGTELLVIGGADPASYDTVDSVFLYNFITDEWRRGAPMPVHRVHFGCVSDSNRMVYVAGGEDTDRNPTKTLMAYDVAEDKWTELPDMAKERYSCQILFCGGKLHVMNDLRISFDGHLKREVEVYDVEKSLWNPMFCEYTTCSGIYVDDGNGGIYKCDEQKVMAQKDTDWEIIVKFPKQMTRLHSATWWQRKLILVGTIEYLISEKAYDWDGEYENIDYKYSIEAYSLDMDDKSWTKLEALPDCVQDLMYGCYLEI